MSSDVDECSIGDNVCGSPERNCTNTPGSFNCDCGPGTTKKGDNCEGCVLKLLYMRSAVNAFTPRSDQYAILLTLPIH